MAQQHAWEREYKKPQLMTLGEDARKDLREYLKDVRRKDGVDLATLRVLDLGCGTGRNALYLAEEGAEVVGIDISQTAIDMAQTRARDAGARYDGTPLAAHLAYHVGNMGAPLPYADNSFDLVLDIMSSNSLNEKERDTYLHEVARVLVPGGRMFYRGLCKDGDTNAKNLITQFPGPERDTYVMPGMGLVERVFSEKDFRALYGAHFDIESLTKKSNYAHMNGKAYKRVYLLAHLRNHTTPRQFEN